MSDDKIGAALRAMGYGDETMTDEEITQAHLGDYYLAYLNYAYQTECTSFQGLNHNQLVLLTKGDNDLTMEETCPDVVEGLYYHLYGAAYQFDVDGTGYASLYERMQDQAALNLAFETAVEGETAYTLATELDGELMGNAYQMTQLGFGMQFQMEEENSYIPPITPVEPTPTPDPDPDPSEPTEEIPDEDVPQGELPEQPGDPGTQPENPEETVIDEEEPPMADAPETGDSLPIWITAAALSGLGLAALAITGRKRKEEN